MGENDNPTDIPKRVFVKQLVNRKERKQMTTIHALPDNNQNTGNASTETDTINKQPNNEEFKASTETGTSDTQQGDATLKDHTEKTTESTKPNNPASTGNNENEDKNANPEPLRRLVIVTGDKGGVGKSTFARGLAQTYIDNAVKFVGLD
ncbi:hypothetical protein WDZ92_46905, partial [Nostoc sp. NIES-2111]